MDPREFPTKGNLMLAKNSLALAHQGYDLMEFGDAGLNQFIFVPLCGNQFRWEDYPPERK